MSFYGRHDVLQQLAGHLSAIGAQGQGRMLAVRGRRQVGKSRLFTRFAEGSGLPYLYFTAVKNADPLTQLQGLTADLGTARTPLPEADTLFASPPSSWSDAFGRLALACSQTPTVVVLDEFPWAAATDPTLEGALQNAWDRRLERTPVLLVLIGSDVTMMERLTEHDRPLYGRAREQLIRPFNPAECAEALGSGHGPMDAFDAHLVTGGYPRLLLECATAGGAQRLVEQELTDENSSLVVTGQRVVDAEFPDGPQARRVLSAMGGHEVGVAAFSQIVGRLPEAGSTAQTAATRALKTLTEQKGVVAADVPVGAPPRGKLRRYRIEDPYLRFWFRFVEQQVPHISRGRADIALDAFRRDWTSWRGKAVEPLVHEALLRLAPELPALDGADEVGSWWTRDNTHEYDVVARTARTRRVTAVGTVKWRERKRLTAGELAHLAGARAVVPEAAGARLVTVCPAGLHTGVKPDLHLDAGDLLAAWRR
ncbi:ATP-binding protein [Kitasatospora indigofera]|uniref:ATP-binding protein n=1 Tax=Kitasatospora indigofera TaxID=67307 RepID=UPI00363A655B